MRQVEIFRPYFLHTAAGWARAGKRTAPLSSVPGTGRSGIGSRASLLAA